MPKILADEHKDPTAWLKARQDLVTASDIFTYHVNGKPPEKYSWWDSTVEEIHNGKFEGISKAFSPQDKVHMAVGKAMEPFVLDLFAEQYHVDVDSTGQLWWNERWPHIGASPDAFVWPSRALREETPQMTLECSQSPSKAAKVYRAIHGKNGPTEDACWLLEAKFSPSAAWQKECPLYYWYQVQTQLHVLDVEHAVIAALTLKKKKYPRVVDAEGNTFPADKFVRTRWDFVAYHIPRVDSFVDVLDNVNERFGIAKEQYGYGTEID